MKNKFLMKCNPEVPKPVQILINSVKSVKNPFWGILVCLHSGKSSCWQSFTNYGFKINAKTWSPSIVLLGGGTTLIMTFRKRRYKKNTKKREN